MTRDNIFDAADHYHSRASRGRAMAPWDELAEDFVDFDHHPQRRSGRMITARASRRFF